MTRKATMVAVAMMCLGVVVGFAMPMVSFAQDPRALERRELLEILRNAKPAPTPPGRTYSSTEAASFDQRRAVGFDLTSSVETILLQPNAVFPFSEGVPPDPPFSGGPPSGAEGTEPATGTFGVASHGSAPTPVFNSLVFPYNTVFKLLMRFNVAGIDYYYVCSAASAGSFHLLTAGHCIYNWDPDDDGDTSDARWASEVWVWAAQTDQVDPVDVPDHPYGEAKAVFLRSYTGWTNSQNFDHDWGVITLNRRVGDRTGWMGRETVETTSLNFSGYPSETPYVPEGTLVQYRGFDANNVGSYTCCRINLHALIYGGHSGGPSWRFESSTGNRWIQGIHSTSDRVGSANDTRLTDGKRSDLNSYMSEDESLRPPTARPDLIEYVFDLNAKDLLQNTVQPGGSVDVKFNVLNAGSTPSGNITIDFYLSTNDLISTLDTLIGTRTLSGLDAWTFTIQTTSLTVPLNQPPGAYYLGWIMRSAVSEYTSTDNTVVIADETLTVGAKPTVTVIATDPTATEAGPTTGTFTISRTGPTTAPLTIQWSVTGTATKGVDRLSLPATPVIPAGASSVAITVTPVDDTEVEGNETVIATLSANAAYTVGTPSSATVTIVDNDGVPTVTIVATDATATEAGVTTGTFTISRTGPTTAPLTIQWGVTGTATKGVDRLSLPATPVIPAGASSVAITVPRSTTRRSRGTRR